MMTRPPDWQSKMIAALAARRDEPFVWGGHDCALFACDIAEAICGIDFAEPLRGHYTTRRGAYKVLKSFAGGALEEAAAKIAEDHNCEEVPILMARRGDIVIAELTVTYDGHEYVQDCLGVCLGQGAAYATGTGFAQAPITQARRAWRIP